MYYFEHCHLELSFFPFSFSPFSLLQSRTTYASNIHNDRRNAQSLSSMSFFPRFSWPVFLQCLFPYLPCPLYHALMLHHLLYQHLLQFPPVPTFLQTFVFWLFAGTFSLRDCSRRNHSLTRPEP
ncbi:hypothetical protein EDD36DRAFT_92775 [Exophiala viscosa]|uniref:Uncharacterized protein n=1 Tax=Exophiala viscosa TaxID=2486360 RepID=A0AAN6I938_9EURO|nr:hypothetical protein EDD36DRAFT_92775 [Exophiala viscosa]